LTIPQREKLREAGLDDDFIRIANKTRLAAREEDRAATHPLLDFSKRPDATGLEDDNFFYFYGWAGTSWNLYRAAKTKDNMEKYGSRSIGGDTQAVGGDKRGANALDVQPQPIKDDRGNIIGWEIPDYSGLESENFYVAPEDDAESLKSFDDFIDTVKKLDAAQEKIDAAEGAVSTDEYNRLAKELADAQAAYDATLPKIDPKEFGGGGGSAGGGRFGMQLLASGGMVNPMRFAMGGFARGTDTVPAMLTPGEFIMSKYAVQSNGINKMKAINSGASTSDVVYNNSYTLTVNAKTDANPNEIAQAVMSTIQRVDDRRIRGVSLNG
jgi:hypothetical protein